MDQYSWENLNDTELLKVRIKDLRLSLEESDIFPLVQQVLQELREKGLKFQPRIYIGDEWFSPEGSPAVAVPFFLIHPRLRQLERKMMYECEGEKKVEFLKLFRHELGHAFDHAFRISRRVNWQRTFGSNKKPYTPESYRARPYSKNFVHNISDEYAQSHPDEDFAETFAVWLNPDSNWQVKYKGWGASKKLLYVDSLGKEFIGKFVPMPRGRMLSDAKYLSSTLERYYQKKKKQFEDDYPDFYDADLLRIFQKAGDATDRTEQAAVFMRHYRKNLVNTLALWTKERKIIINQLLSDLIDRSRELKLVLAKDREQSAMELATFLATLVANYRLTGRFKRFV